MVGMFVEVYRGELADLRMVLFLRPLGPMFVGFDSRGRRASGFK